MEVKYSIIIPHYNDYYRLYQLLKSIPLSRPDIQTIVVDDCSPKPHELTPLKTKYTQIDWLSTTTNSGAGAARNLGLAKVKGKYLLFADSDDQFTKDAFTILDNNLDDMTELTYFLATAVKEDSQTPSNRADRYNHFCLQYLKQPSDKHLLSLKCEHVVPWAKVYNATTVKKLGIKFTESRNNDDTAFNVKNALQMKSTKVIPKEIYVIFEREGSITTKTDTESLLESITVLANLAKELNTMGVRHNLAASGYLIRALRHGPIIFIKVLKLARQSGLKLGFSRLFNLSRWVDFIKTHTISYYKK